MLQLLRNASIYIGYFVALLLIGLAGGGIHRITDQLLRGATFRSQIPLLMASISVLIVVAISAWSIGSRWGPRMEWVEAFAHGTTAQGMVNEAEGRARRLCKSLSTGGSGDINAESVPELTKHVRSLEGQPWDSDQWLSASALFGEILIKRFEGSWVIQNMKGKKVPAVRIGHGRSRHLEFPLRWVAEVASDVDFSLEEVYEHLEKECG